MDCFLMTRLEDRVTVSVYSVPENEPDPYVTETDLPVLTDVLVFVYALFAPTHVFDEPVSICACQLSTPRRPRSRRLRNLPAGCTT